MGVVAIVAFAGALPRSLRLLSGAAGAYACILVAALGLSDTRDIERYSIPIVAAVALIIAFSAHTVGQSGKLRVALCACAFFWGAHRIGTAELETPETYVRFLSTAWSASPRVGRTETWEGIELRRAQASVPDGERIFAAVDDPYRLDFRRNDILIADMPGYTGGLPTLQGPNALAKYLREHEVAYVLFVKAQYSKDYYRTSIRNAMLQGDNAIWKTMAILTLDFSENLTLIARDYPPVYDSDGLVVVRLQLGSTSWPR